MIRIIIFVLVIFVSGVGALNNTITLAWDFADDPEIIGYNLYTKNHINEDYRLYSEIQENDLADWAKPAVKVFSLDRNLAHYFVVTAFSVDTESGYSNEVIYSDGMYKVVPTDEPQPAPARSGGGSGCFISTIR